MVERLEVVPQSAYTKSQPIYFIFNNDFNSQLALPLPQFNQIKNCEYKPNYRTISETQFSVNFTSPSKLILSNTPSLLPGPSAFTTEIYFDSASNISTSWTTEIEAISINCNSFISTIVVAPTGFRFTKIITLLSERVISASQGFDLSMIDFEVKTMNGEELPTWM